MKKIFTTFFVFSIALAMQASFHLTLEKWIEEDLVTTDITKDTTIVVIEYEYDEDLEEALMEVRGQLYSDESQNITVTITRKNTGIIDQFCAAGNCVPGNGELTQVCEFTVRTADFQRSWFTHYTPIEPSTEVIVYTFNDGVNPTIKLTVRYSYEDDETAVEAFPRKYLFEHFTGEGCGYCPYGMYSIVEYRDYLTTTPCIWVSHHTYTDELTISKSTEIAAVSGVEVGNAPLISMNRTKVMGTTIAFHPGYLVEDGMAEAIASKCDTVAEASVVIDHTYNAETRELNVTVSGQVANTAVTEYLLTVLIKENGLIGKQADYYWSWKTAGYKEFMHPCVIRDLLTVSQLGDTVKIENQAYSKTFTYTVSEKWVAENCNVVAYITPLSKKPVINAEETPLVAGTTGGTEYQPFGITENKEPTNASKLKFDALELTKVTDDKLAIELVASSSTRSDFYGPLKLSVYLEFNTTGNIIPADTLDFVDGNEPNTFSTGTVDLVEQSFGGSHMAYYLATDMEQLCHIWRIQSGGFLMDKNGGFFTSGRLDNGKNFQITCTLPEEPTDVEEIVFDKAHVEKLVRDGQFIIRIDDIEYDMQGRVISK